MGLKKMCDAVISVLLVLLTMMYIGGFLYQLHNGFDTEWHKWYLLFGSILMVMATKWWIRYGRKL